MFKKRILLTIEILAAVAVIIAVGLVLIRIITHPFKNSAWVSLAHSDLANSLLAIFIIFLLINTIGEFISVVIMEIDVADADKFLTGSAKFSCIAATVIGLLLTESSDEFQLVATAISFILIFEHFFPKELKEALVDAQRKLIHKRSRVHKEKNKK